MNTKQAFTLMIASLSIVAVRDSHAEPGTDSTCTRSDPDTVPTDLTIGDGRALPPDVVVVPAHIDAIELTSAEWGVMSGDYLQSWIDYDGGSFLWKRQRVAPDGGELDPATVNWSGTDDNDQELPSARGARSAVALYTYTIKSSVEKTKQVKRFAEATVAAQTSLDLVGASANARVNASVDTQSDFEHNISEKVEITISIKCASYNVPPTGDPESAILYFGPDSVRRNLPLPIRDDQGRPKVVRWNPIVADAEFSADNAATNGNAIACWFKYRGEVARGEVTNTSWQVRRGAGAEIGVTAGWRLWKFTTDISVQGKTANEWNDLQTGQFSRTSTGAWALNGHNYWLLPAPPTQAQRDDFQTPCRVNQDRDACAQWDNIKAAYMSAIMRIRGVDGATDYGPNFRMAEWQGAMLSGSFRRVGDWLDSSTFFQLAELQQVGNNCPVQGLLRRVQSIRDDYCRGTGVINGLNMEKCNIADMARAIDNTTRVGRIQLAVLDRANTERVNPLPWIRREGSAWAYECARSDWDWSVPSGRFPYWFFGHKIWTACEGGGGNDDYICWGCKSVNNQTCDN